MKVKTLILGPDHVQLTLLNWDNESVLGLNNKRPITRFELHKKEPTKLELQKNELTKLELHKLEPIQKRTLLQIWSQNIYFRTLFLKLFI